MRCSVLVSVRVYVTHINRGEECLTDPKCGLPYFNFDAPIESVLQFSEFLFERVQLCHSIYKQISCRQTSIRFRITKAICTDVPRLVPDEYSIIDRATFSKRPSMSEAVLSTIGLRKRLAGRSVKGTKVDTSEMSFVAAS